MGTTHSIPSTKYIDLDKKIYLVIDLYLKPKDNYYKNFDINSLKTNAVFKKSLQDIIVSSLINRLNYSISLPENNLILISKKDKDNSIYLELNAILQFTEKKTNTDSSTLTNIQQSEIVSDKISIEQIKLYILNKFFELFQNQYGIITPEISVILLYKTLYSIDIYQK